MKYDINVNPEDTGSSHALTLELVGTGKRVLDVGCATGYLAAALKDRGNVVTGVEIDPEAGELARPHLEHLVIGDLEHLDLVAELGEGRFDVIVFADVLEHLVEPLPVLRQAPALLAPGGSVVVSIPNIAHGAMRLALMQGRFEYQDLGLLDNTHLRFFTRSSLDDMLRLAGLVPVEQRRGELDPFGTEIALRPEDFAPEVVDAVRRDPDSTTYQFVIRCVAAERPGGEDLASELVARNEEIAELRHHLSAVSVVAPRTHPPTLGVVGTTSDDPYEELRRMVVVHEARRRLPSWAVRWFDWEGGEPRPTADGTPVAPMVTSGPPPERSSTTIDCAVLAGTWTADAVDAAVQGISADGCPVHLAGLGGLDPDHLPQFRRPGAVAAWLPDDRVRSVPDPLLLADRVVGRSILDNRAMALAATGVLPAEPSGYILASVAAPAGGGHRPSDTAALSRALDGLAEEDGVALAVLADTSDAGGSIAKAVGAGAERATVWTEALDPIDLLAAVASAQLVVTDQPRLLWLATALRRPAIGLRPEGAAADPELVAASRWLADPDLAVATPGALGGARTLARRRAVDERLTAAATDELELFLDELCDAVGATGARRLASSWPARMAEAQHRADVMTQVNDSLRYRLQKQQVGFGSIARRIVSGDDTVPVAEHRRLIERVIKAEAEVTRMQEEVAEMSLHIQATESTLTMRTLAPARRVYGRLRNR